MGDREGLDGLTSERAAYVTARQAAMQAHAIEQGALSAARQLASAARQITDAMHAQGVKLPLTTLGAHGSDAVRFIDKNTAAKIAAKAHKMDADADAAIPSAGRSESMYTGPAYPDSPRYVRRRSLLTSAACWAVRRGIRRRGSICGS